MRFLFFVLQVTRTQANTEFFLCIIGFITGTVKFYCIIGNMLVVLVGVMCARRRRPYNSGKMLGMWVNPQVGSSVGLYGRDSLKVCRRALVRDPP